MTHSNSIRNHPRYRLRNLLHTGLLLSAMVLLVALVGGFFGMATATLAVVAGVAVLSAGARISPQWVMRMQRARRLHPAEVPGLHQLTVDLARRAALPRPPELFLVPSAALNAFAVGKDTSSALGLTAGLLQSLDRRQLTGVLAHEISHITHRDLWVMGLADTITRMTRFLSLVGQVLVVLALPLVLLGQLEVPWLPLLLLIAAPTLAALLQLALSRTREFEADRAAAELTGDPEALASALEKLEAQSEGWLRRLLRRAGAPIRRLEGPALLRSHPATAERIERLRALAPPRPRPLTRPTSFWDAPGTVGARPGHFGAVRPPWSPAPHRASAPHRAPAPPRRGWPPRPAPQRPPGWLFRGRPVRAPYGFWAGA